jgi:hypothetical protein
MDKADPNHSDDVDDIQVPSDNEKHLEDGAPVTILDIPDPDEGLSEEEKKQIV